MRNSFLKKTLFLIGYFNYDPCVFVCVLVYFSVHCSLVCYNFIKVYLLGHGRSTVRPGTSDYKRKYQIGKF